MDVLATQVKPEAPEFAENQRAMESLVAKLRHRLDRVRQGGGEAAVAKHKARGKLLARDRIERLPDPAAPFLELAPPAAWGLFQSEIPAAGLVTPISLSHVAQATV